MGFEISVGFGSSSGLQRPGVTTVVAMGGGLLTKKLLFSYINELQNVYDVL